MLNGVGMGFLNFSVKEDINWVGVVFYDRE